MLEPLAPRVGYVYYIAVLREHRGTGIGAQLLDNALRWLRSSGSEVVYAAVRDDGVAARGLFEPRRFRIVPWNEPDLEHGGLGADRFRHQMTLVPGEVLLGLRFASEAK
jgi:GNAT superfamily N-acetyltransferase